jgi:ankyrin repeat protein
MDIIIAAQTGNVGGLQALLDGGANINSRDQEHGRTAISWAAGSRSKDAVDTLLKKKAEVNSKDNDGRTPLSWAARNGRIAAVRSLLLYRSGATGPATPSPQERGETGTERTQANEKSDSVTKFGGTGTVPEGPAAQSGEGATLEGGETVDVDSQDSELRTPLAWAAIGGHVKVVEVLLDHRAEIELEGRESVTVMVEKELESLGEEDPFNRLQTLQGVQSLLEERCTDKQLLTCRRKECEDVDKIFKATVVNFPEDERSEINTRSITVVKLLDDRPWRQEQGVSCTWLHVPANNASSPSASDTERARLTR